MMNGSTTSKIIDYSRALRSIKQQEEVPDLLVSLLQLMAERRELNIQPVMNQKVENRVARGDWFSAFLA